MKRTPLLLLSFALTACPFPYPSRIELLDVQTHEESVDAALDLREIAITDEAPPPDTTISDSPADVVDVAMEAADSGMEDADATTDVAQDVVEPVCAPNMANCDGTFENGCETNLSTSNTHCGSCGHVCPERGTCVAGRCERWWQLGLGRIHSCALRSDGAVFCWGSNNEGQLGLGGTTPANNFMPQQLTTVPPAVQVHARWNHSCSRTLDGRVWCWGFNGYRMSNPTSAAPHVVPNELRGVTDARYVGFGSDGVCVLRNAGSLWCLGRNDQAMASENTTVGLVRSFTERAPFRDFAQVGGASWAYCATRNRGELWCWGHNMFGSVGVGSVTTPIATLEQVLIDPVRSYAPGLGDHTCAIDENSELWCWGQNNRTQVSNLAPALALRPLHLSTIGRVDQVVTGWVFTCIRQGGQIRCWGGNDLGQCGVPSSRATITMPTLVPGIDDAVDLSSGADHACVQRRSGGVWCWGRNTEGQLGRMPLVNTHIPERVPLPES